MKAPEDEEVILEDGDVATADLLQDGAVEEADLEELADGEE